MLIVEDGSGLSDADAYISVAFADDYHAKHGNADWSGEIDALEAAIRKSSQYLDARYNFRGCALTETQALEWPRDYATWPVRRVQEACAELALRALSASLYTDQSDAAVTEETVGPLTVKYATAQNGGQVRFAIVDELLSPYTGAGRLSIRLERA